MCTSKEFNIYLTSALNNCNWLDRRGQNSQREKLKTERKVRIASKKMLEQLERKTQNSQREKVRIERKGQNSQRKCQNREKGKNSQREKVRIVREKRLEQ